MSKDYKAEQKAWRERAKKVTVLWSGGTFNMGIKSFKRINKDPDMRRWYKDNAWLYVANERAKAK